MRTRVGSQQDSISQVSARFEKPQLSSLKKLPSYSSKAKTRPKQTLDSNGVKLSNSYYNDRQNLYIRRSKSLSESSFHYQSKDISYSQMKKYNEKKIETIVQKRTRASSELKHQPSTISVSLIKQAATIDAVKSRITSLNHDKYHKLINGGRKNQRSVQLLAKTIERKQASAREDRWHSPFRDTDTFKAKFEGKSILPKKISGVEANSNRQQLKVLNLDRLFRVKQGQLKNVIPLPKVLLSSLSSRQNLNKSLRKKDTIHEIIDEYNKLIKISKAQKMPHKKLGVKGINFTRPPTLQQLMGIRVHEYKKTRTIQSNDNEELEEQVFLKYNQFYARHMKKDVHLARRLLAGLKQTQRLNLEAFTRFYSIFVNKVATVSEKAHFFLYFFIPHGQQRIQLDILKLILELMCDNLPQISGLKQKSQFLSKQQKKMIFLEALNRVLFAEVKQGFEGEEVFLNRAILQTILQRNQDAMNLLLRLLVIE